MQESVNRRKSVAGQDNDFLIIDPNGYIKKVKLNRFETEMKNSTAQLQKLK